MSTKTKESRLIRACKRCDLKTVQELLEPLRYIRINGNGRHRLKGEHVFLYKLDINCREPKFKMTPLMIACLKGSKEIVEYLIDNGAILSLKDIRGNTALHLACMKQKYLIIEFLLTNKADPNEVNMSGWNCLMSGVNFFHEDSAVMLLLLLQNNAKIEHRDKNGLTCIDHAVRRKKINAIRVILNFNINMAHLCTRALTNAAIKGYLNIVLLLLNFGVNPNKIDPITGSGPLHEAVRYDDVKDEKSRFERLKLVYFLCLFGADPELANVKRETPMKLAVLKEHSVAQQYIDSMKSISTNRFLNEHFSNWSKINQVFYSNTRLVPKFVNMNSPRDSFQVPEFPFLRPKINWTRNDFRFCSGPKSSFNTDLVTNLIDGNLHSIWKVNGYSSNWVIFDMKSEHIVTKIRIYCWKSNEMPNECYLQASNSLEGPWINIQTLKCEMIGSSLRNDAGVSMEFGGFYSVARYWRLYIVRNHGAKETSFHGIEFYGYDYRINKLIDHLKLIEYEYVLVENDLNQIEAMMNCTFDQFERLPIENKKDKEKLWNFILEFQRKVRSLKTIEWFNEPTPFALVGQNLPAFSVTSSAFLTDTLQLICHGGGTLTGETCIDLEPGGIDDPSMAIYRNISFTNAGKFLLEIRAANNPNISLFSQPIQIFESEDPDYQYLLQTLKPDHPMKRFQNKRPNMDNTLDSTNLIDTEDEIDKVYEFPNFSDHDSKINFTKPRWKPNDDLENSHFEEEATYAPMHNENIRFANPLEESSKGTARSSRYDLSSERSRFYREYDDINDQLYNDSKLKDIDLTGQIRKKQHEYETQSNTVELYEDTWSIPDDLLLKKDLRNYKNFQAQVFVNTGHYLSLSPGKANKILSSFNNQSKQQPKKAPVYNHVQSGQDIQTPPVSPRSLSMPIESPLRAAQQQPIKNLNPTTFTSEYSFPISSEKTKAPLAPMPPPPPPPPPLLPALFPSGSKSSPGLVPSLFVTPPTPPDTLGPSAPIPPPFSAEMLSRKNANTSTLKNEQNPQTPNGLLKFKRTSKKEESIDVNDTFKNELLRKVNQRTKANNKTTESETNIYRFDPNKLNNSHDTFKTVKNQQMNGANNGLPDRNDTFTQRAKNALESYKNSKSDSSSLADESLNVLSNLKTKKVQSSKHGPLPFRENQSNEPKFVD